MNKWILALVIGVLIMTTLGQARVSGDADLAVQYSSTGWVEDAETRTWSYSSADAPTYVFSVNDDMTTILSAGMRVRFKQSAGTYKYAIITAVGSFSGGATLITAYFGTDYDLDNEEVTNVAYSAAKSPFGFPMNPDKWTVEVVDTTQRTQNTPTATTWYNIGTTNTQINVPIGLWILSYRVQVSAQETPSTSLSGFSTLSTANNSESNTHLTDGFESDSEVNSHVLSASDIVVLTEKTTYYLNAKTNTASITLIAFAGSIPTIIRAVCAYL
jgi:hypothetical protein